MPLLRINAQGDRPVTSYGSDIAPELRHALRALAPGAPVVIMVHGYKFSPGHPQASPHDHILSLHPSRTCPRLLSWPRALGFDARDPETGLAIAFGWEARGTIWQAYGRAQEAGRALACVIRAIAQTGHGPVHLLAHSLGARVALAALHELPMASMGRMILMAGAEFRDTARRALRTPAGQTAEILNITSAENSLFDLMFRGLVRPLDPRAAAIGRGCGRMHPNWIDIAIDRSHTRRVLAGHGIDVAPPQRRICHWSGYLRPGVFTLYSALLRGAEPALMADLAALPIMGAGTPRASAGRWGLHWPPRTAS